MEDSILSAKQFVEATNENQGASMHLQTGRLAQVGKDHGWLVGGHPDPSTGKQIPGVNVKGATLPLYQAHAHLIKSMIVAGDDPKAYAGSWDDHEGNISLDVSTHVPTMAAARTIGNDRFQKGIFGLRKEPWGNDMTLRRGRNARSSRAKARATAGLPPEDTDG